MWKLETHVIRYLFAFVPSFFNHKPLEVKFYLNWIVR